MVAGYPDLASIPSREFMLWRSAALHMALRQSGAQLVQPPEWAELDPSERAAISSLLGVVMTKLLVERLLDAPLFLFLDVHFRLSYPPGIERIRPDFVAMTRIGQWFSVEAKGKARFRHATLAKGKKQASALGSVNGNPVQTGVVCVTSFRKGHLEAHLADPAPKRDKLLSAKIEPMEALRLYYAKLYRFREFSEPVGESGLTPIHEKVRFWHSEDLDVDFGIVPELESALDQSSPERALAILQEIPDKRRPDDGSYLGSDGIIVIPGQSWGG